MVCVRLKRDSFKKLNNLKEILNIAIKHIKYNNKKINLLFKKS